MSNPVSDRGFVYCSPAERRKDQMKWYEKALAILIYIGACLLGCWGLYSGVCAINKHDEERAKQWAITRQSNTVYSLQHPEIVGTNELGETIKRYHLYTTGADVYEVGKTKTDIKHYMKGRTETKVTSEEQ